MRIWGAAGRTLTASVNNFTRCIRGSEPRVEAARFVRRSDSLRYAPALNRTGAGEVARLLTISGGASA